VSFQEFVAAGPAGILDAIGPFNSLDPFDLETIRGVLSILFWINVCFSFDNALT
jgi:hypothetical protein